MGSVTSYDVTKGRKKRHQLPNYSSDEVTSEDNEDSDEDIEPVKNRNESQNISNNGNREEVKSQKKLINQDGKFPKPKPRSLQSKMSIGTSSNSNSSKSYSSSNDLEASDIKDGGESAKPSTPISPNLSLVTRLQDGNQEISDPSNNLVDTKVKGSYKERGTIRNDGNKRKELAFDSKHSKDNTDIIKENEGIQEGQSQEHIERNKTSTHIERNNDSNMGLR